MQQKVGTGILPVPHGKAVGNEKDGLLSQPFGVCVGELQDRLEALFYRDDPSLDRKSNCITPAESLSEAQQHTQHTLPKTNRP